MVRLLYSLVHVYFLCLLFLLSSASFVRADPPARLAKTSTSVIPPDQQRYLLYVFYNNGYATDPNFNWTSIETAIKNGCNGIELCVPWSEIYPTRNGPAYWATLDKQIDRIVQLGAKVALRIGVHRDVDRVDTYWTEENGVHNYHNELLYRAHGRQFSLAHQPTLDLAVDFVRQVAQRYSNRQQQGDILFMAVTNTTTAEQEYVYENEILYQATLTNTITDYSTAMVSGFRTWLTTKYTTLSALNTAWNSNYSNFSDIQPTGLLDPTVYTAFVGKRGKDWYAYRHKVHKNFIDQTTSAIKTANSSYKVINGHGSIFDDASVFRGTLGFKSYAQNTDGVKVDNGQFYPHRFTMDLVRSNVGPGKWVMNEMDGQNPTSYGLGVYLDWATQSFQHGAKAVTLANFTGDTGLEYVRQICQQVWAQGWKDSPIPDFKPVGTIPVKLSSLVESGYSQLGIQSQWNQTYNQNGNQPVNIPIDEDILDTTPVTTTPPTSTTTAPTTTVSSLSILAPAVDCTTGLLTFKTSGGDGTPIDFMAIGLTSWSSVATVLIQPFQRTGVTFTLKARQSGTEVSYLYTTNCSTSVTTPANQSPVLVTPIASQTATLAQSYSFVIPAATFSDPDGQLVSWAVSGLPAGLTYNAATRTISGTPATIGSWVVTVVVTDNGGATAQTTFTIKTIATSQPIPAPPTTPATPSSLSLIAPTVDCPTGLMTFHTSGGDGSPIEFLIVGYTNWSAATTANLDPTQRNGLTFVIAARQNGRELKYSFTTNCSATAPANQPPVLVTPIASQTATLAQSYSFVIPAATFSDPDGQLVSWAVSGLPAGLTYNAATRTISGTPATIGSWVVTVVVTDNGGATAQTTFTIKTIATSQPIPAAPTALSLTVPGFDCVTGKLTFHTSGGDGTPIEYMALGIKSWSTDSIGLIAPWQRDVVFTLLARQSGKQVSYTFKASCTNQPPVVITPIANQTATLARSYSFVIPANTFSDPDGQLVSWVAGNLPVGLTFDAITHTISGTPSLIGPNVVTITVTDNGGASVQTTFIIQVLGNNAPPAAPVSTTLTMLAPDFDCTTGKLIFRSRGGDGSPVEYFAVGIKTWSQDSTGVIVPWQRDGVTFTLQARQSGKQVSYSFRTSCSNKPPVVVTPVTSQTATLARLYSFVIPAATFSDPDGQLVSWDASNLPVGLTFDATTHTISGTPSLIGPNVVTITVTDNGGASVQTTFIIQVLGSNTLTVTPLTAIAPAFDCTTGKLIFRSRGGDGSPVEYFAVGIKTWSLDSTGVIESWQRNGVSFILQARQSGKQASYFFKTSCSANIPPVVVTPIASQTATMAHSYSFVIPAATFSDPDGQLVSWAADNLPAGLTFDATTHTISGTATAAGSFSVTITVTDNAGATVQAQFTIQVISAAGSAPKAMPSTPGPLALVAPAFDCATGKLIFKTSGGDGSPMEFMAVGIRGWSSDSVTSIDTWLRTGVTFVLKARQNGKEITYNFVTACGTAPGGRQASPEIDAVSWQTWPNPVEHELTVAVPPAVTITKLRVVLHSMSGLVQESAIESSKVENGQLHLMLAPLSTGLYLLRVYDGDQPLHTLKVLHK